MSRADQLAALVAEEGLDQLIVGDLVTTGDSSRDAQADVFWVCGFTGTSALCLVGPDERVFLTDFRYTQRAEREVDPAFDREQMGGQALAELAKRLHGRVGYDEAATSVRSLRKLSEERRRRRRAGRHQGPGGAPAPPQGRRGGAPDRRRR